MSSIQGFSSQLRYTGLSGLDTESIISELMTAERIPLDSLKQKRTLVEWKQEAYRDISSNLIGFKSKFFDIINRSTYMLSGNSITPMSTSSSDNSYVTATASADANKGAYNIKVKQIATSASTVSTGGISKKITGEVDEDALSNLDGKKMVVTLDGVTKLITLEDFTDCTEDNLEGKLQKELDKAFGLKDSGYSKFNVNYDSESKKLTIDTAKGLTRITIGGPDDETSALSALGIDNGATNRTNLKSTLKYISLNTPLNINEEGKVTFKINGKTIEADKNDTLQAVFERINNDETINVTISYDELTDKVNIKSKQTGAGSNLILEETGSDFFAALNINTKSVTQGKDAVVTIDGENLIRSSNTFTVNDINYTLHKAHESDSKGETITITQDTETVIKNIKSFVEEYNKLIDTLNGKVKESYNREYTPLTEQQKESMSDDDIEKWEKTAKTGLLRNDSLLQQITLSMRQALYEKVEGVSLTLKDIGIGSQSYTDYGKLHIDEESLEKALLDKPDEVTKLLTGVSDKVPSYTRDLTTEQKNERYKSSGLFHRLSDILEDYVSTKRNVDGQKGILLQKAGIAGDLSNTENLMYEELQDYDERIDNMLDKLIAKEENYYKKFSRLETIMTQMNQQSAWIMNQFGGGQ